MNFTDALGVLEDYDSEGFHNVIENMFDMVLEDTMMFLPHPLTQLEPNLFLKVYAPLYDRVSIPVYVDII